MNDTLDRKVKIPAKWCHLFQACVPPTENHCSRRVTYMNMLPLFFVPVVHCCAHCGRVVEAELSTTVVESVTEVVAQLREVRKINNWLGNANICRRSDCINVDVKKMFERPSKAADHDGINLTSLAFGVRGCRWPDRSVQSFTRGPKDSVSTYSAPGKGRPCPFLTHAPSTTVRPFVVLHPTLSG